VAIKPPPHVCLSRHSLTL